MFLSCPFSVINKNPKITGNKKMVKNLSCKDKAKLKPDIKTKYNSLFC